MHGFRAGYAPFFLSGLLAATTGVYIQVMAPKADNSSRREVRPLQAGTAGEAGILCFYWKPLVPISQKQVV
ncbi:hypothetical protein R52603_01042 [Paraburkholderia saeva]|uniref:Uncharacterized protein n=1 Tax=Paraburkholderia saeva TaxID=2777537 RepID=A0A9N8X2H7_9BURK|nr:hypothetical protein R52603_01042 [Paraburkholderia saeva]CAG4896634.1 hypothetical protein R70241_02229 [Paraburkholderia saeva]CAG4901681.1 hypothetical protein LMG31841_03020 [Paraburkholderia saeva]